MNLAEAKAIGLKFPERKRIGRGIGWVGGQRALLCGWPLRA